jgi:hypothetical protein
VIGLLKYINSGQAQWLTSVIPAATQEAEIGRLAVQGQPGQTISETPSQQTWCGGMHL